MYNTNGQLVKILVAPVNQTAGVHQLNVDLSDLQPGLYYSVFKTADTSQVEKIVLVR
ncbi:MAG: T9SS type A sorting domain-containing protein [Saprospiraceae bacterium]